jgi:hypothetical protein
MKKCKQIKQLQKDVRRSLEWQGQEQDREIDDLWAVIVELQEQVAALETKCASGTRVHWTYPSWQPFAYPPVVYAGEADSATYAPGQEGGPATTSGCCDKDSAGCCPNQ